MKSTKQSRLLESVGDLERALKEYKPTTAEGTRSLSFLAVTKAFEVSLEYLWKHFKYEVEDRGLEAPSPKDSVRAAAEIGLTKNPDFYIKAINARNQSVHDYFSMTEEAFVMLIRGFLDLAKNDLELH